MASGTDSFVLTAPSVKSKQEPIEGAIWSEGCDAIDGNALKLFTICCNVRETSCKVFFCIGHVPSVHDRDQAIETGIG